MILLKNGLVFDHVARQMRRADVLISDGRIVNVGPNLHVPHASAIDLNGKLVAPGLVDCHVHFRQPGEEHKEDIVSGGRAAAAGGFTAVVAEPNTIPPIDTPARLRSVLKMGSAATVNFYSKAAITRGQKGRVLTAIEELAAARASALSDDGNPVPGCVLMRNAMHRAKMCGLVISPHCEESPHYRAAFRRRVSSAAPYRAEADFIKRDIALARQTGARVHFSHVTMAESIELIASARQAGLPVTAETTPHHAVLTEKDAAEIGTNAKCNPPLRTAEDVAAVREALAKDIIDVIASDHAPHSPVEKARCWDDAPFGVIGLETTLGVVLTHLVGPGLLSLGQAIAKMSHAPAVVFGLDRDGIGWIAPGAAANIAVIDIHAVWKVESDNFHSKARNCPFNGWTLRGRAVMAIARGKIAMRDGIVAQPAPL